MLKLSVTTQFKKDFKRCKKRGYDLKFKIDEDRIILTASRTGTHSDLFDE